jgi:hypothetical protein
MKVNWFLWLAGTLVVAGCGKTKNAAPPSTTVARETEEPAKDVQDTTAASPRAAVPDAAKNNDPAGDVRSIEGVVDPFLTSQLRIFVQEKGRLPETFAEFAGARLDSVPRLAKGLRFAIDPATQEVKIVQQ